MFTILLSFVSCYHQVKIIITINLCLSELIFFFLNSDFCSFNFSQKKSDFCHLPLIRCVVSITFCR